MTESDNIENQKIAEEIVSIYFSVLGISQILSNFKNINATLENVFKNQFSSIRNRLIEIDHKFKLYLPDISGVNPGLQGLMAALGVTQQVLAPKLMEHSEYLQKLMTFGNSLLIPTQAGNVDFISDIRSILQKSRLDNEWVKDSLLLATMEVLVTQKLEALGIDSSKLEFHAKLKRLSEKADEKNVKLDDLLPKAIYNIRNKVLHEGKSLSLVEFETIKNFMIAFVDQILSI